MSEFFDPYKGIEKHGSKLPHWQQGEVIQFVTFRLGDSLPAHLLKKWGNERRVWLQHHPEPWSEETEETYHHRFTKPFDHWLDQGHGSCLFRESSHRDIFAQTIMRDHDGRAKFHAWVIMPNHVHLLFTPHWPLEKLIKTWKGVSARKIGKGSIWQRHYRDTLIRNARHFIRAVRYIRRNPVNLPENSYSHWESDRAEKA